MEKLKFPIVKAELPKGKRLNMDDYLKFVSMNLKFTIDRRNNVRLRKLLPANVPFSLK